VWQGKTKINSWKKLVKHMRVMFLPHKYVNKVCEDYVPAMSEFRGRVYIAKFYKLVTYVDLGGMRQFQDALNFFDSINVPEAHQ
jgi:hypothetical protein